MAELTGMTPTKIEAAEISQAFSTGAVESMITSPTTGKNSKIWENGVKYFYDIAAWFPKNMVVAHRGSWNKLDKDTQDLIMKEAKAAEANGRRQHRRRHAEASGGDYLVDDAARAAQPQTHERLAQTPGGRWVGNPGAGHQPSPETAYGDGAHDEEGRQNGRRWRA